MEQVSHHFAKTLKCLVGDDVLREGSSWLHHSHCLLLAVWVSHVATMRPSALRSQWIPQKLWARTTYHADPKFLDRRHCENQWYFKIPWFALYNSVISNYFVEQIYSKWCLIWLSKLPTKHPVKTICSVPALPTAYFWGTGSQGQKQGHGPIHCPDNRLFLS